MNDLLEVAGSQAAVASATTSGAATRVPAGGTHTAPPIPERGRLEELEARNAQLLRLVGELLVVNQQLRERHSAK